MNTYTYLRSLVLEGTLPLTVTGSIAIVISPNTKANLKAAILKALDEKGVTYAISEASDDGNQFPRVKVNGCIFPILAPHLAECYDWVVSIQESQRGKDVIFLEYPCAESKTILAHTVAA